MTTLILGVLLTFNASADQDFCSTAGRFGESIYLMKDSTDAERQTYINYSLSLNSGFLSLSETDRLVFFRYLMSTNKFVESTKKDINNPYSFFYRKCMIESLVAIKKIEKNLKKCSIVGEFTGYVYEEKNKGKKLHEITSEIKRVNQGKQINNIQEDSLIDMMMNAAIAVYKNKKTPQKEVIQEQYRKCLSMS